MHHSRIPLLFALCALLVGCSGSDEFANSSLIGVWNGEVIEGEISYDLSMRIARLDAGGEAGTATYSGELNCMGTLTYEGENDGVFSFREAIDDEEECADEGRIDIWRSQDGTLQWEWYYADDAYPSATAVLRRGA